MPTYTKSDIIAMIESMPDDDSMSSAESKKGGDIPPNDSGVKETDISDTEDIKMEKTGGK